MIRIHHGPAPDALRRSGPSATEVLCKAWSSGTRKFRFRSEIYAHPEIKAALKAGQWLKCCFCEGLVGDDGHVEHYRPKGGAQQSKEESRSETGYYWLAYEWTNLLLCCADCNVRHKANLFPLADPGRRAVCHLDSTEGAVPLFIDPGAEDPEDLLTWAREFPRPREAGNRRAMATIEALKLDTRDGLVERRRQGLAIVERLIEAHSMLSRRPGADADVVRELEAELAAVRSPRSEFAAMIRAFRK